MSRTETTASTAATATVLLARFRVIHMMVLTLELSGSINREAIDLSA